MTNYLLPCFFAFASTIAFAFVFNIHGFKLILLCGIGGALGWCVFLSLNGVFISNVLQYFLAAIIVSIYCEIMSRWNKVPATLFFSASMIPLFPGRALYEMMNYLVNGQTDLGLSKGLYGLAVAGALAMGIVIVSSTFRFGQNISSAYQRILIGIKKSKKKEKS
ncbi:MAG: threonine/serine exporter [Eubacteriaceae bacterium]|jgi:uncharacterized membrane protein YjjB (DUF3815 family)|nr:threonine/serine exporter [Eubacteriaceae bacterium]